MSDSISERSGASISISSSGLGGRNGGFDFIITPLSFQIIGERFAEVNIFFANLRNDYPPAIRRKEVGKVEVEIIKVDTRAFLKLGSTSVEVKDYKISSPMHGRTELEVVFEFDGETTLTGIRMRGLRKKERGKENDTHDYLARQREPNGNI